VICIGQLDQPRAGFEVSVLPTLESQPDGKRRAGGRGFGERQQHELPGVESKTLLDQNSVQGTAEGHQLRLDALDVRNAAKAFEHLAQQYLADRELWVARRDKQPAHQSLVLLEYVEAIAGGLAVLHRGTT